MGKREGESWSVLAAHTALRLGIFQLKTQYPGGRQHHPPLCGGPCGQDDSLDLSVVFWNIPIHGVVGVIFLESPNMGRIPQTLKLSHPV